MQDKFGKTGTTRPISKGFYIQFIFQMEMNILENGRTIRNMVKLHKIFFNAVSHAFTFNFCKFE